MGSETNILPGNAGGSRKSRRTTRVMLVDDSLTVRSVLSRIIDAEADLEVVAKTSSAELAIAELKRTPADVVLLDLEMPGMGGLHALPKILAAHDGIQVLVVSSLTSEGAEPTLAALSMGAADTMAKPQSGDFGNAYCKTLLCKIRALGRSNAGKGQADKSVPAPPALRIEPRNNPELLAIGASTGGIHALCIFLRALPRQFDLPILVTQHLPDSFMSVFARQLELAASREAVIAADRMPICHNTIYIAPGSGHLNVRKAASGLMCKITHESAVSGCTPSVDPMLTTAADATGGHSIGLILSGMGKDGAIGARHLVDAGGTIFAQDEESSAVWGMPRAVTELGLASAVLTPAELALRVMASAGARAWK